MEQQHIHDFPRIDEILTVLNYDGRDPERGFGIVGEVNIDKNALIIYASLADPFPGCNAQRLQICLDHNRVHLSGQDETGNKIKMVLPSEVSLFDALDSVLIGIKKGKGKTPTFIVRAFSQLVEEWECA